MSAPRVFPVEIVGGAALAAGKAIAGPGGLTQGRRTLAWTDLENVEQVGNETRYSKFRGMAGAVGLAAPASLIAGPVGMLGAAALGAASGLSGRVVVVA